MMNGEAKILAGAALITVNYAIYMLCTPNPADGMVLAGIVGAISALVGGCLLYTSPSPRDRS